MKEFFLTPPAVPPREPDRFINITCCSVAQLCLTLCHPMDCSTPVFPVLHHLPEFAQTCPLSWFLSLTQSHVSLEFRLSCFDLHWSACSFTQQMLPGPHCVPGTVWPHTDGGKDADTGQRLAVRAQLLAQAQPLGRGQQKAVRRRRRVSTAGPGASTVSGSGAPSPGTLLPPAWQHLCSLPLLATC